LTGVETAHNGCIRPNRKVIYQVLRTSADLDSRNLQMGSLVMFRLGNLTSREAWSTELTGGRFFPSSSFYELLSQTQHPIGPHREGGFLKTLSNITNGRWSRLPCFYHSAFQQHSPF
jgi:hypothetical protein